MNFISLFLSLVISTTTSIFINLAPTSAETLNAQEIEQLVLMIKKKTNIPVLIPSFIPWADFSTVYVSHRIDKDGYTIQFSTHPSCSANACTFGRFSGSK